MRPSVIPSVRLWCGADRLALSSPVAFEIDEGNVLRRISLIRTIGEMPRGCLAQPSPSWFVIKGTTENRFAHRRAATTQGFQVLSSSNSPKMICGYEPWRELPNTRAAVARCRFGESSVEPPQSQAPPQRDNPFSAPGCWNLRLLTVVIVRGSSL